MNAALAACVETVPELLVGTTMPRFGRAYTVSPDPCI